MLEWPGEVTSVLGEGRAASWLPPCAPSPLPVPLSPPLKASHGTTEHCNRGRRGRAVCLGLTPGAESRGQRWL